MACLGAVQSAPRYEVLITSFFGEHVYYDSRYPGGKPPQIDSEKFDKNVRFAEIWPGEISR